LYLNLVDIKQQALHSLIDMNNMNKRDQLIEIAQAACDVILKEKRGNLRIYTKRDGSVVTSADHASEQVIVSALRAWNPDTPVVSEEEHAAGIQVTWSDRVWLVDPLDSTSGFARGSPDYAVCMAQIVNHKPVWGVVAIPETGVIYVGDVQQTKVWKAHNGVVQEMPPVHGYGDPLHCVLSPTDIPARNLCGNHKVSYRGSALKFGMVAEGAADVYVRSGCLMHWDIAAGDALVHAAGGRLCTHTGVTIKYSPDISYMPPFVATSRAVHSHPLARL
jgi:3'(2'), 5'-bisphosphate nucleotidase